MPSPTPHEQERETADPRPRWRCSAGDLRDASRPGRGFSHGGNAARLMELLGLSDEELCTVLDADPLTLLSGQLDHRPELPILLTLLDEASERAGTGGPAPLGPRDGPAGRPLDALLRRDFAAFEDALAELAEHGFVLRGGGGG